ncbi:hypothetical protein [Streptomyces phaeochromogenes]|uniref:hypothetical protein n=1 Tax=Streptomyces phaeochromogenes TaxID=1923 RepID=UPI002DDAA9B5|nr:hypothetical protein [Streptomyces phaeochromogenes]WRZ30157.1 hypothetical protein OG931_21625 [Streptomyces phaeochromogenes]
MDAATLGAVGTIAVGLAAATGAFVGKRGENRANAAGAVFTGYGSLVDQLQEELGRLRTQLTENERLLAAAYADLSGERADKAALQGQITQLTTENGRLRQRIIDLGGQPP